MLMLRTCHLAWLPAFLLLIGVPEASAQWSRPYPGPPSRDPGRDDLSGFYMNTSNGGKCQVMRHWGYYVFINENGTPARFVFSGPDRMRMVAGDWDPDTMVVVQWARFGRPTLRFQGTRPGGQPGYWVPGP
jgi:hypothetical protein